MNARGILTMIVLGIAGATVLPGTVLPVRAQEPPLPDYEQLRR